MTTQDQTHPETGPETLTQFLTYRLAQTHSKLNIQAQRLLDRVAGITLTQWRILALIGTAGTTTSSELTRVNSLDKGLLSRRLKTMIAHGLVQAETDASDRRVQRLSLTPKGQDLFETTLPHMRQRQVRLQSALNADELEVFLKALSKIEAAADDI